MSVNPQARILPLAALMLLVFVIPGRCESRSIGIKVEMKEERAVVSLYSDVKEENRRNLSVQDAAKILKDAKGWGSAVFVVIVAHGVHLREYLPIVEAISQNTWLDLVVIEGEAPSSTAELIKQRMSPPK